MIEKWLHNLVKSKLFKSDQVRLPGRSDLEGSLLEKLIVALAAELQPPLSRGQAAEWRIEGVAKAGRVGTILHPDDR